MNRTITGWSKYEIAKSEKHVSYEFRNIKSAEFSKLGSLMKRRNH